MNHNTRCQSPRAFEGVQGQNQTVGAFARHADSFNAIESGPRRQIDFGLLGHQQGVSARAAADGQVIGIVNQGVGIITAIQNVGAFTAIQQVTA
ncbi:hypothetical protein LTEGF4_12670 [Limnohabitans sp. TEGF004]|nr:hypothetical protein LTEGF4_12670 [Limnohabitans sp. TEGF004]